jgi:hypothetical protein
MLPTSIVLPLPLAATGPPLELDPLAAVVAPEAAVDDALPLAAAALVLELELELELEPQAATATAARPVATSIAPCRRDHTRRGRRVSPVGFTCLDDSLFVGTDPLELGRSTPGSSDGITPPLDPLSHFLGEHRGSKPSTNRLVEGLRLGIFHIESALSMESG